MLTRSERARKIARSLGLRAFRGHWNLKELLDDCESVAFELELRAPPHVKASAISWIAIRRVKIGRQFPKRSVRSIGNDWQDRRAKRPKFTRSTVNLEDMAAPDVDPAELACFWMDYEAWLARLDRRKRKLAKLLATGESTRNAAIKFAVSDGRISQIRRELQKDWEMFQGQN